MHRFWKIILCLVFLTIALFFAFLLLSSNWKEISNLQKREEMSLDIQAKPNHTKSVKNIQYENAKRNDSFFLTYIKKVRRVSTNIHSKVNRDNKNPKMKYSNKHFNTSNTSSILRYKGILKDKRNKNNSHNVAEFHLRNIWDTIHGNGTTSSDILISNLPTINITPCSFSFDKKSLFGARTKLTKPFYLFYVNLKINGIQHLTEENQDDLMHWQYVKKDEKFLVQLPVDFDLLTFNLLVFDKEETPLEIDVVYNNSNCTQEFSEQVTSLRSLLWNELFHNKTDYYLCNRKYLESTARNWLYYITTIWVGYDLYCSRYSVEGKIIHVPLRKDKVPLVTPIFCYFLSLQFIWIFAWLDIKKNKKASCTESTDTDAPLIPSNKLCFKRDDRPYSMKRFVIKLIYSSKYPTIKFLTLMYFFILCPFGVYRTMGREKILSKLYYNYMTVVRPSEPFFFVLCNVTKPKDEDACRYLKNLDIVYATCFPLLYICFGAISFGSFLSYDSDVEENESALFFRGGNLSDRFTFWFFQFCKPFHVILNNDTYQCSILSRICDTFKDFFLSIECKRSNFCHLFGTFFDKIVFVLKFLLSLILCLFPIIPLSCSTFKRVEECCTCSCSCCPCSSCRDCKRNYVFKFIWFVLTFVFCLRPIISTFTFLLRSFTYFFFVALPIRTHIMQFTLIFGSTFVYFIKYCHEFVNMNSAILNYIFDLEEEKRFIHSHTEKMNKQFWKYIENKLAIDSQHNGNASIDNSVMTNIEDELFDGIYDIHSSISSIKSQSSYNQENNEVNMEKEINDSLSKILKYVSKLKEENSTTQKVDTIEEKMFDDIYSKIVFVKRKFYFLCLKMIVVFMYLFITTETFLSHKDSLTEITFQPILEFLLVIFGPYAISFFLKENSGDFLNKDNKREIRNAFMAFKSGKSNKHVSKKGYTKIPSSDDIEMTDFTGYSETTARE